MEYTWPNRPDACFSTLALWTAPHLAAAFDGGQLLLLLSRFSHVLTLCDPIDGSPPGSPVPGILQAKRLEVGRDGEKVPVLHLSVKRPQTGAWI